MDLLSEGALSKIKNGEYVADPILQYINHIKHGSVEKILLNDGKEVYSHFMLAPSINHYIRDRILVEYSIIKITNMSSSMMPNQTQPTRVILIMNLEVLVRGSEVGRTLGSLAVQVQIQNDEREQRLYRISHHTRTLNGNNSNNELNDFTVPLRVCRGRIFDLSRVIELDVTPIADLTPYDTGWTIKVRVTFKSEKKSWSNSNGQGHYFNMSLMDESGEIGCVAFKDECDKFFHLIQPDRIYYISKANLKKANKQFAVLNNDYQLSLRFDSEIELCLREDGDVPRVKYNFIPIKDLEQAEKDTVVDVLGIVQVVDEIEHGASRNDGRPYTKREVSLVDQSGSMILLTLWNLHAEQFDAETHSVLAAKNVKVNEWNDIRSLNSSSQSVFLVDPDIPEANSIRTWYDTVGNDSSFTMIKVEYSSKPWLTIAQARDLGYGEEGQTNFYTTKATVNYVQAENCLYRACPAETRCYTRCWKKVIEQPNGMFWCNKCQCEYPNFQWRIIASVNLADWSGNMWVTAFNDPGEVLLGITADELGRLKETDINKFLGKLDEACMKSLVFRLRARRETFNGQSKLRTVIEKITLVDPRTYGEKLLNRIRHNVAS